MNDFHLFSIYIENKDFNKAMLILRDKPESISRKIMIKARVKVPAYTGESFWAWAQNDFIETCRAVQENINVQPKHNTIQNAPLEYNRAQSRDTGLDKTPCVPDNAARSLQHDIPEPSTAGVVCRGENGVPSVHPGLGDKRAEEARKTSAECKPSVVMGNSNPTGVRPGLSGRISLVRAQHSVRICRRHPAARARPNQKALRYPFRPSVAVCHDTAADPGQLRPAGAGTGNRRSTLSVSGCKLLPHYRRDTRRWRTTDTEWDNAFSHPTCGHAIDGYSPHAGISGHRGVTDTKLCSGQRKALYATPFFLCRLPRPPGAARACTVDPCVVKPGNDVQTLVCRSAA